MPGRAWCLPGRASGRGGVALALRPRRADGRASGGPIGRIQPLALVGHLFRGEHVGFVQQHGGSSVMRGGDGLPRVLPSEADVRAEQESARCARGVTVAALVDAGHVLLVEQVVDAGIHRHGLVHRIRTAQIHEGVGRRDERGRRGAGAWAAGSAAGPGIGRTSAPTS
ncbi:hypothetical protein G6F68_016586 [Rhizopus microsporus]|nr:hypothetical protein G6F68_016586 [Rhizopus microsporus]